MVNYWALTANSGLEDFYGACHSRDLGTATYIGQVLLTSAGKAVTAASGDKYFGRKWVYNQISRSLKNFPSEKYTYYQTGAWTREGVEAAQNLLEFVQTCLAASQLLAGEEQSPELWPSWEYGESGLFRDLSYNILHQGDRVLLHKELHRQVSLKPQVAFVWALCQGQSLESVSAQVEQLAQDVPVLRTMSEVRVQNVVNALMEKGLISTRRERIFSSAQEA
nr:PqqD family protein [Streptomyces parvus]